MKTKRLTGNIPLQVATLITLRLEIGKSISLDAIVRELGTTKRTLQWRLKKDCTNFYLIRDEIRREYAIRRILDGYKVSVVSDRLGFSQPISLCAAFRRWTGMSPTKYRKQNGGEL